jgi:hypothetical protein
LRRERRGDAPQEDADAEHPFVAHHPDLDRFAVLERGDERDSAPVREIDVRDGLLRAAEDFAGR